MSKTKAEYLDLAEKAIQKAERDFYPGSQGQTSFFTKAIAYGVLALSAPNPRPRKDTPK